MNSSKLFWIVKFSIFLLSVPIKINADAAAQNPDVNRTTPQLIRSRGYRVETHEITTKDGYILTYFRIPHGKKHGHSTKRKPCVLLQHGLLSSSFDWFNQNEDKTLPFLLAEEGYDVWLGNSRGTSYSMKHKKFSSSDPAFWRFSWEEMGIYDLPAAIDYMLKKSGNKDIFYIGHSQGTTQFFVMSDLRQEYNAKIRLMSAYAPVAFMTHIESPIRALGPVAAAATITNLGDVASELGAEPLALVPLLGAINKYAPYVCDPDQESNKLCDELLFVICGYDPKQLNQTEVPVALAHFPNSASIRTLIHYGQEISTGRFHRYDWGKYNLIVYGNNTPPSFNPKRMTAPMAFYYGQNDLLANPKDVKYCGGQLPNLVRNYLVPYPEFNHLDFLTAKQAYELLYKTTIEFMNQHR